ncbi:uncharacterized protein LOC134854479 [Symsagittifera roscoffensis]|uniref:uncharacterized protein LOC134854479 n=1 Tax=Symsagittifera roscoffensis TaxID=84072 RepID=UPI00307BFFC4
MGSADNSTSFKAEYVAGDEMTWEDVDYTVTSSWTETFDQSVVNPVTYENIECNATTYVCYITFEADFNELYAHLVWLNINWSAENNEFGAALWKSLRDPGCTLNGGEASCFIEVGGFDQADKYEFILLVYIQGAYFPQPYRYTFVSAAADYKPAERYKLATTVVMVWFILQQLTVA